MACQAADAGLSFDAARVRRVITGSAPNSVAWYPDVRLATWLYYEPGLRVPRNVNEGRDPGYGTMSQWRDDASHDIDQKLVFTTSTNPDQGLKALVVPGEWMVKSHGGESQQFHYTGLDNPLKPPTLIGSNNLGGDAQTFLTALTAAGRPPDDLLFYIAGIYNSQTSEDFLAGGSGSVMRVPLDPSLAGNGVAGAIADLSRQLRNLHWLAAETGDGMPAELAESLFGRDSLEALGLEEQGGSGGRFRQRRSWRSTGTTAARIDARVEELRTGLDAAVDALFA